MTQLPPKALLVLLLCTHAACVLPSDQAGSSQTGAYQLTLTLSEAVGTEAARVVESIIAPDETISWEIYVPQSYRAEQPAGLMVYISPSRSAEIPRRWKSVMDQHNLVWVAARRSGNRVSVARRAVYALLAPTVIGNRYKIDRERIYLTGLSGGGRVASMVATEYAHLFKGAIYNCGVNFWKQHPPERFEQIKQNHYVFITGTMDHALEMTKKVHRQYLRSGVENSKLVVVRKMTHRNPDARDLDQAIQYLDSRIYTAPTTGVGQH